MNLRDRAAAGYGQAVLVCLTMTAAAVAQAAGTDIVRIRGGGVIRGSILSRQDNGSVVVAVRRAWLTAAEPRLAEEAAAEEPRETRRALEQLTERIDSMLKAPDGVHSDALLGFLRRERERVQGLLEGEDQPLPSFLALTLQGNRVQGVELADPGWRVLVQWGWRAGIEGVETMPQRRLAEMLAEQGVDTTQLPPSLADQLPPLAQDDDQWRARVGLLEDSYGVSVNFQGTGDIVVRSDQEVTIEALLPVVTDMLRGDVGGLLDLFGGGGRRQAPVADGWLISARKQAGSAGHFRATRVQTQAEQGTVSVESAFEVQLADGSWGTVWRSGTLIDASQPRPVLEERIATDPRVGQAINAVKALGVVDEDAMNQAIRFGAATMEAQEAIDIQFGTFRSEHTLRLDGPPLMVVRQAAVQ
jgi:hypothetical protein